MQSDAAPRSREVTGLIAGRGSLPVELAAAVKARRHLFVCVALEGADAVLDQLADHIYHVQFGQLEEAIVALRRHGATRVLVAGGVSRTDLLKQGDALFQRSMGELRDRRDQTVFTHLTARMREVGLEVISPLEFVPDLAVLPGVLSRHTPTDDEWDDVVLGMTVARALAAQDVGQTVVLKRGVILAVEAAEGTDATIRRGGAMVNGAVVVKAARPKQDARFDLPTIGAHTIALLTELHAAVLAVEAGKTLLLERPQALAAADQAELAIVGVDVASLSSLRSDQSGTGG
jgi:DUF1009 family protein